MNDVSEARSETEAIRAGEQPGWRMPAEWEEHRGCLIAWPAREDLWGRVLEEAKQEYAGVANAIGAFEQVFMVCPPGAGAEARRALRAETEIVELPLDDSWLRDSGPIFVRGPEGALAGADFRFNSWGERFLPYDEDARVSERILDWLAVERLPSELVLEGGSIAVDGEGTLITTEQCLLHPNRNPSWYREEIEAELGARLGVNTVVWLPFGHADDLHTDGHVDGVCAFAGPGVVLVQSCDDPAHPDFERMRANRAVLQQARDAAGRGFRIVEVPFYPYFEVAGERTMVSYVNFYLANGGVVVPLAGRSEDEQALELLREVFPEREVVGTPGRMIAHGGGGVHCITQQVPVGATTGEASLAPTSTHGPGGGEGLA